MNLNEARELFLEELSRPDDKTRLWKAGATFRDESVSSFEGLTDIEALTFLQACEDLSAKSLYLVLQASNLFPGTPEPGT